MSDNSFTCTMRCMRCRVDRPISYVKQELLSNKRFLLRGSCPECKTSCCKFKPTADTVTYPECVYTEEELKVKLEKKAASKIKRDKKKLADAEIKEKLKEKKRQDVANRTARTKLERELEKTEVKKEVLRRRLGDVNKRVPKSKVSKALDREATDSIISLSDEEEKKIVSKSK